MTDRNDSFAEHVIKGVSASVAFAPSAYFDPDGDFIEFHAQPDDHWEEVVDETISVLYSNETDEIVGSIIKNVTKLLARFPGFQIEIHDGKVSLVHVLTCVLWASEHTPDDLKVIKYKKLIEVARQTEIIAELQPC